MIGFRCLFCYDMYVMSASAWQKVIFHAKIHHHKGFFLHEDAGSECTSSPSIFILPKVIIFFKSVRIGMNLKVSCQGDQAHAAASVLLLIRSTNTPLIIRMQSSLSSRRSILPLLTPLMMSKTVTVLSSRHSS